MQALQTIRREEGRKHKLDLACDFCVLPSDYAGLAVKEVAGMAICEPCLNHAEKEFKGLDRLVEDLSLTRGERVGVTVSGGKDSMFAWMTLVDLLGKDSVVALNHHKVGLVHPLACQNLQQAEAVLCTGLLQVSDANMLNRFCQNLGAILARPDPAMVKVVLCAGCRYGIHGQMFKLGLDKGIKKIVTASSYLEDCPFKFTLLQQKGRGDYRTGLLAGLKEQPVYVSNGTAEIAKQDHGYWRPQSLFPEYAHSFYSQVLVLNFHDYIPNVPDHYEQAVATRLGWQRPDQRSWHFDCLVEPFRDLLYLGLLGYTEYDDKLSAMVRYGLFTRRHAAEKLALHKQHVRESREDLYQLAVTLGAGQLVPQLELFCKKSRFF